MKNVEKRINLDFADLTVRETSTEDSENRYLTGYAMKFDRYEPIGHTYYWNSKSESFEITEIHEKIDRSALDKTDLSEVAFIIGHEWGSIPLGNTKSNTLKLEVDDIGLRVELLLPNTEKAKELYESVKRGDLTGMSFGAMADIEEDETLTNYDKGKFYYVMKSISNLFEVTATWIPAYKSTELHARDKDSTTYYSEVLDAFAVDKKDLKLPSKRNKEVEETKVEEPIVEEVKTEDLVVEETKVEEVEDTVAKTVEVSKSKIKEPLKNTKIKEEKRNLNMNYNELSMAELTELQRKRTEERSAVASELRAYEARLKEEKEPTVLEELGDKIDEYASYRDVADKDILLISQALDEKEKRAQEIKARVASQRTKDTKASEDVREINREHYLKSEKAVDDFVNVARRNKGMSTDAWKDFLESNYRTVNGDLSALMPTMVVEKIIDCLEANGTLYALTEHIIMPNDYVVMANTNNEIGYGYNRSVNETKKKQNQDLVTHIITQQYVYKFVELTREQLDMPNNVLLDYIITEMSDRIKYACEVAMTVGYDLAFGVAPADVIHSIKPVTKSDDLFVTEVDGAGVLTGDTLDELLVEIKSKGRKVIVGNSRSFLELKKIRDANGLRVYEFGTTVLNGISYDTIDNIPMIDVDWMAEYATATATDIPFIVVDIDSYKFIQTTSNLEMFSDFKLDTNSREYLTEIKIGGGLTKCKSASFLTKGTAI